MLSSSSEKFAHLADTERPEENPNLTYEDRKAIVDWQDWILSLPYMDQEILHTIYMASVKNKSCILGELAVTIPADLKLQCIEYMIRLGYKVFFLVETKGCDQQPAGEFSESPEFSAQRGCQKTRSG
jgi:hypothetical protein